MIAWLLVVVFGAIVGTVCDHLHVITRVLYYTHPVYWDQAWWVPLLFGGASIAIVLGARMVQGVFASPPQTRPSSGRLIADGLAFVAAYVMTSYGHENPRVLFWVLVAFWISRLPLHAPWTIAYSLLVALGGTAFEATWSRLGFFYYRDPDFVGVARWLPAIYLHAALLGASIEAFLPKRKRNG